MADRFNYKKKQSPLLAEHLQSLSISELSDREMLQELSPHEFRNLRKYVYDRAIENGHSKVHANNLRRRLKRIVHPYNKPLFPPERELVFQESEILDAFISDRKKQWRKRKGRTEKKEISLKEFSFLDKPRETLQQLKGLAQLELEVLSARVSFEDYYIYDVGPYLVLGVMRQKMLNFMQGGEIRRPVLKVIEATKLKEFLRMQSDTLKGDDVWAFKLQSRDSHSRTDGSLVEARQKQEKVVQNLIEAIDQWLGKTTSPYKLTGSGKSWLGSVVAEILDNAQRHSTVKENDGGWYITGFLAKRGDEYLCHLSIISLGRTIAESLLDAGGKIKDMTEKYCKKHISKTHSKDTLATVFALQDGITSRMGESQGGVGMMQMTNFSSQLGDINSITKPRITIISGNSCIMLKDKYHNGKKVDGKKAGKMSQYFNTENDPEIAPDKQYVFDTDIRFPGTIISIRFALNNNSMERKNGG